MIVAPEAAEAPVIPPVLVPSVHANVLGTLADSATLGLVPLHVLAVVAVVTDGIGLTVTTCVAVLGPLQPAALAVIVEVPLHPATYVTAPASSFYNATGSINKASVQGSFTLHRSFS